MDAKKIVYEKFITPFVGKTTRNVGVELEFPLVNKNGGDIDIQFVSHIMDIFEAEGFSCVLFGVNGEKLFMENEHGDCVSFDNSYNNFEFSMMYGASLLDIQSRFRTYFELAQKYLENNSHTLCGCGTNPNFKKIGVNHTPFNTYNMVQTYLHNFKGEHNYPDFPAFISSVQTHMDVDEKTLPKAYTLFSRLDFVRGLLFSNSPDFENGKTRIFRDYLWQKSGFGNCPNITGTVDTPFNDTDDIVSFFVKKGLFNRKRNGEYEVFSPVPIEEYFENPKYEAQKEDIDFYLSFCNVEITSRGTLEVRSDCTQRFEKAFSPPAFNVGILENTDEAKRILDDFEKKNSITLLPSQLREIVASGKPLDLISDEKELNALTENLKDLAYTSLIKRGMGEEVLL